MLKTLKAYCDSAVLRSIGQFGLFFFAALLLRPELAASASDQEKLKIAVPKALSMGLMSTALVDELFAKNGAHVEIVWTSTGRDASRLLFEREVDLAAAYDAVVISNHLARKPQRIYSRLHSAKHNTAVVARQDRGIKIPSDLRGKRVGVPGQTNAHYFLKTFLEHNFVKPTSVIIHIGEPDELIAKLRKGNLDAIVAWEPTLNELKLDQTLKTSAFYLETYVENSLLLGLSNPNPEIKMQISKVLTALLEAQNNALKDPEGARIKMLKYLEVKDSPSIRQSLALQTLDLSVTNLLLGQLNFQKDWILTDAKAPRSNDARLLEDFDLAILKELSPYLVTVQERVP